MRNAIKVNKTPLLFLSLTLLTVAATGCTSRPDPAPSETPTERPTQAATKGPTVTPTGFPTVIPTAKPTPEHPPTDVSLGATWVRPSDGMRMVYVPAGEFTMGSADDEVDYALTMCNEYSSDCQPKWFERELPAHTVTLGGFWIDRTEVTNEQYRRCVAAGACEQPEKNSSHTRATYYGDSTFDDYPVIWVNWHQAAAYCEWTGGRLPTEAEWEYAARGPEGHIFPWGDEVDGTRLNYCDVNCGLGHADQSFDDGYADTAPVGTYPEGASWCGVLDMAGNVWEWVSDWSGPYSSEHQVNPTGPPSGERRVVRGGSWVPGWLSVRSAYRDYDIPSNSYRGVGFRCATSSDE